MQYSILKNVKIILIYLIILLVLVFFAEKLEKTFLLEYIKITIVIYFINSLYLNKNMFINIKTNIRYILIIILCASMTALFGLFALIIAVNFDLAIGGRL